ncbi:TPA: redoxin domain-containing protein, partial [Listeria monocytogenes]|nr:redoxin domain-containing protein [Listeria monocytogenes]
MNVHDFSEKAMNGKEIALSDYKGKVLLIVNTASKCGLTPQLEGLEAMYKKLGGDNFEILGFPCNQFLRQDPGSDEEILEFCQMNYGVTFQMFSKIKV